MHAVSRKLLPLWLDYNITYTYKMKKTRLFSTLSVALMAVAALTFSSCINDDDDDNNALSQQEQMNAQLSLAGTHRGKMVYYEVDDNGTAKNDTVDATWMVNPDSTLVIYDFPLSQLGDNVADNDVKAAINALPNDDLTCQYYAVASNPVQCIVNPYTIEKNVTVNGTQKNLKFVFYANSGYSFMQYVTVGGKQTLGVQILYYSVWIDNVEQVPDGAKAFGLYQE